MENFIPFGAQYYRAPTPTSDNWEKDLKNIKEMGFNTIKIWAQWRWNNPAIDYFDFSDLDKLMELAEKNNLKVIINTIFDVAPAWYCKMYPESVMITADGRRVEYQTASHRQIGGAPGPCYHHEEGRKYRVLFLEELVKRFKNHPALYIWDLWNEPELTCGLLREPKMNDMVCFCHNSSEQFIHWLKCKYENVKNLNARWNRNYNTWDEVEIPRSGEVFNDMIDWRTFFIDTLTNELKLRVAAVKKFDRFHPVMVHTVPIPFFNHINACSDEYSMAKVCDVFGNSIGSHPFSASISTSCAKGKMVINSEIHALVGKTYKRPSIPSFEDMKRHILIPMGRGIKGFLFWQYRCETLGTEAPAWGLLDLKGGMSEWLKQSIQINDMIQRNSELISAVHPLPAEIAVVNGIKNQIFDWCASSSIDSHYHSVFGAFMAMYKNGHNVDIISCDQILDDDITQYKVIYYPFPYYMESSVAEKLKKWIDAGGTLISEAFFGSITAENCLHSTEIPGYGFDKVFGVAESQVTSSYRFSNAYSPEWAQDEVQPYIELNIVKNFGSVQSGDHIWAYCYKEELVTRNAEVLARFEDGKPAVTCANHGSGKGIMIGSLLGYSYSRNRTSGVGPLINSLVGLSGVIPGIQTDNGEVRGDILKSKDGEYIVVVDNDSSFSGKVTFTLNVDTGCKLKLINLMTQQETEIYAGNSKNMFELNISSNSSDIFALR